MVFEIPIVSCNFFFSSDLKEDSLASFDVKIAAACLMIHCSAYSPACSGSEIVVE